MSEADPRVKVHSVDTETKTVIFQVFNAYFYEFRKLANGTIKNVNRWRQGSEGRVSKKDIFVPHDAFVEMVKQAHGIAEDRFKDPVPEPSIEPEELGEKELSRDEMLAAALEEILAETDEEKPPANPAASPKQEAKPNGYPCADFVPADRNPRKAAEPQPRKKQCRKINLRTPLPQIAPVLQEPARAFHQARLRFAL